MKKKEKQEIRAKSLPELKGEIQKKEDEIVKLSLEVRMAKVKNTSILKRKSDELALLKTVLREKELFSQGKDLK